MKYDVVIIGGGITGTGIAPGGFSFAFNVPGCGS